MGVKPGSYKRKLLATSIASALLASFSATAHDTGIVEEVMVTGVRAAQETAVNIKRDSATIVDAISAEDIGKLPDATIADSLQRISGIQIRRSAGEGGSVNIRGLPQVVTQLNGEQYLGANSVVSVQPNFGDIPSQLFKGADVYKSATADLGPAGITGTVNLKTYRPFDFKEGLTLAGSAEMQYGKETADVDPSLSALAAWQNESVGALVALTYANVNLSNSYNGFNTAGTPPDVGWTERIDAENVGIANEDAALVGAQGFAAWNQITERERAGLNASFQADLGEGFTLTVDAFYTNQEEYNRKLGMSATNKWQGQNWIIPQDPLPTGARLTNDDGSQGREFHEWSLAELNPNRVKSFTQNDIFDTSSRNVNIQLDYDNGGAFTGSFRALRGEAERKKRHGYNEGDLTDGTATGINPLTWTAGDDAALDDRRPPGFFPAEHCGPDAVVLGENGGCFQQINPLGYTDRPQITYDTRGTHPHWNGFDRPVSGGLGTGATLADYMANQASYNVGAFSSENNENSEGRLTVFRMDGSYAFEKGGFITSVDVGVRSGQRSAEFERYNLFSPFYSEGCEAQWKATDVQLHAGPCQDGELVTGTLNGFALEDSFVGYTVLPYVALNEHNNAVFVTDFGPVSGIPGVWAVDPKDYDDPEAFHNRVFGSTTKYIVPGSSFNVEMNELGYYAQANFEKGAFSGNVGLRVIETELNVKQNIAGDQKDYGNTNLDAGDIYTRREYTDYLPSLNVNFRAAEDVVVRFAYTEAMTPLDLNQYGDGLALDTAIDSDPNSPTTGQFIVTGGSLNGNPQLNPWRSKNMDLSVEWYLGGGSMLNAALFYIDVDSFVRSDSEFQPQPDADGVVRREVPVTLNVQGDGGTLEGLEVGAKLAFYDFLSDDSFLAYFGVDTNYTYSPSEQKNSPADIFGNRKMFPDNSEHQFNLATWYENGPFQARAAYNYRSERLAHEGGGWGVLNNYQSSAAYVDISASYDVTEAVTVYLNGSNVTGEFEDYYLEFKDQYAFQSYFEPRYTLGVRARF